jgi:endoglucanase
VRGDVLGNSLATVEGTGGDDAPTILLAGHIDEIGVIVTHVDDRGYLYLEGIGGWDPQVLVAQRIRFLGRDGDVFGVVGRKPIHALKPEERDKAAKMSDLWVDIGATSRAEALERIVLDEVRAPTTSDP